MKLPSIRLLALSSILLLPAITPPKTYSFETEPFRTANRAALVQIYGLPSDTSSILTPSGKFRLGLTQDISNSYSLSNNQNEHIIIDGEQYRWTLSAQYGLTDKLELGIEVPFILQAGGFLDWFIVDWHNFWGLPQGGRTNAPKDRILYGYKRNGVQLLDMHSSSGGIADLSMTAGYSLINLKSEDSLYNLAIKAQLKLPTGNSNYLLGSGGTDFNLLLTGSANYKTGWGDFGGYAAIGGLVTSNGDILKNQRQNLISFGNIGVGWSPLTWLGLKAQIDMTSKFYNQSSLKEIGSGTAQATIGGTLKLPSQYKLDIGISEDIAVSTAPDVTIHLGLSKSF